MSVARFLILAGPGHRYHGDGMQPQVLLTIYDDKVVWGLNDLRTGENRYCNSSVESLFDDAMLLLAVFAYPWLGEQTPELHRAIEEIFGTDDPDVIEEKLTSVRRPAKAKMKKLYEASREAWRKQRIVRLAAVELGTCVRRISGLEVARMPRAFRQTMEDYGILDWEILTTREFSGFSHFDNLIIRWSEEEAKH